MEYSDKYFVFDKDLGRPQQPGTEAYARQNSIGRPVVELTDEQRAVLAPPRYRGR